MTVPPRKPLQDPDDPIPFVARFCVVCSKTEATPGMSTCPECEERVQAFMDATEGSFDADAMVDRYLKDQEAA